MLLQEQWQVYCAMRWGVNKADVKIKIPPKSIHLRVLYPLTYPLPIARSNRQDSGKAGLSRVTSSDHLQVSDDETNLKVSFTGVVGESTRSIQSNFPFPPLVNNDQLNGQSNILNHIFHMLQTVFNPIESKRFKHSTPFVYNDGASRLTCINPRNISYYEVTILQVSSLLIVLANYSFTCSSILNSSQMIVIYRLLIMIYKIALLLVCPQLDLNDINGYLDGTTYHTATTLMMGLFIMVREESFARMVLPSGWAMS